MHLKPKIEWCDLLAAAPYFLSVVHDTLNEETDISELNPLLKAVLYFDIFDGEVSNGGVAQYFYNQAFYLPDFENVPAIMAAHPALLPVMHIVNEVHAAWASCADDVKQAREEDEWPEALFNKYEPRFDSLQTEFYEINHKVSNALCHAILKNPHDYFEITPIDGLRATGVQYINLHQDSTRLRFKNGFPVGPNIVEEADGSLFLTRFDDARDMMECMSDCKHYWIHYPSGRSVNLSFRNDKLESFKTQFDLWYNDGAYDWFDDSGNISSTTLYQTDNELSHTYYHPNGKVSFNIITENKHKVKMRFWPDGALNAHYLEDENGGIRVLKCFGEHGENLAPDGNGQFYELISEENNTRLWREGALINGKFSGEIKRFIKNLSTGEVRPD